MKTLILSAAALLSLSATAALAEGDAEAGEAAWRGCRSCHSIVADDGTTIQRGGRTGPNLYGVAGRHPGAVEGFNYSELMTSMAAANPDMVWNEELFVEYVANPVEFLGHHGGEGARRGTMSFRLNSGAEDMWAYLVSVGPAEEAASE